MSRFSIEPIFHLLEDEMKGANLEISVETVENFYKPTHMRPFEPVWQVHVHVDAGNGLLCGSLLIENSDWVGNIFNTHLANVYSPGVMLALDIFHLVRQGY